MFVATSRTWLRSTIALWKFSGHGAFKLLQTVQARSSAWALHWSSMVEATSTTQSSGKTCLPLEEAQPVSFWVFCQDVKGVTFILGYWDPDRITIACSSLVLHTNMKDYILKFNFTNQVCWCSANMPGSIL